VWIDRRDGREQPLAAEPMAYIYPTISPDSSRLALNVHDDSYSIWTWSFSTATLNRITLSKPDVRYAIWTPDGKRLIYTEAVPAPRRRLMWANADGSGNDEAVSQILENQYPMTVSPDGKYLLFRRGPAGDFSFALQSLDGDRSERRDLLQRAGESLGNAEISPDGRWVAYQGGPSNAPNVYVQPFPNVDAGRMRVSSGSRPLWSRNGRELFFLAADTSHLASVPVTPGPTFTFGRAQDVVDVRRFVTSVLGGSGDGGRTYDVSPDGRRFLVMAPANEAPQQIVVIEHWMDEFTSSTGGR
jgi:Tol biopolymer transport system component